MGEIFILECLETHHITSLLDRGILWLITRVEVWELSPIVLTLNALKIAIIFRGLIPKDLVSLLVNTVNNPPVSLIEIEGLSTTPVDVEMNFYAISKY